ncbi:MAG: rod shape-determining protein RodA [Gammaproteobacteria bacterium]|nr:rod shape-determining protein RodA [Gammaproteobacteria bacterium]
MNLIYFIQQKFQKRPSDRQRRTLLQVLHLDAWLLGGIATLAFFGLFILYSASNQQLSVVLQQVAHLMFAALVLFILAQIPPHIYRQWTPGIFAIGLFMLIVVLIVGHVGKGAQRWLPLGIFNFQPSELMKLAVPMMLSWYYAERRLPPNMTDLAISAGIIFVPAFLTAIEPDFGTAFVIIVGGGCVLLFAGIRWRFILLVFLLLLIAAPIIWHSLHAYQQIRILTFINPERAPLGAGYHIIQSKIAVGSGGFFGKGWLKGTQSHLHFLPEHSTDFIFAVIAEELGLFGSIILLMIYVFITARCFYIAYVGQDTYERLLSSGLTLTFFLSAFLNIGMVCGVLPVVGLPLPLVSYGGTSMVTTMAAFGILMAIHMHKKLWEK